MSKPCLMVGGRANEDSIDNEDKLREKVEEALTVYDEYVKNAGGEAEQEVEGKTEDGGAEAEQDGVKA